MNNNSNSRTMFAASRTFFNPFLEISDKKPAYVSQVKNPLSTYKEVKF